MTRLFTLLSRLPWGPVGSRTTAECLRMRPRLTELAFLRDQNKRRQRTAGYLRGRLRPKAIRLPRSFFQLEKTPGERVRLAEKSAWQARHGEQHKQFLSPSADGNFRMEETNINKKKGERRRVQTDIPLECETILRLLQGTRRPKDNGRKSRRQNSKKGRDRRWSN